MNKVIKVAVRKDKNDNDMKVVTFAGIDKNVYVSSKFDEAIYAKVVEGAEFEIIDDGNFKKIKYEKPKSGGNRNGMMEATMNKKADLIKVAQDNKEHGIKLASCNGQAANIVSAMVNSGQLQGREAIEKELAYWKAYLFVGWEDVNHTLVKPF